MIYQWKPGSRLDGDPQVIGEHLERLRVANNGLTWRLVVDDAKTVTSPLHKQFTWDESEAAEQWRLYEASLILRCILVTNTDGRLTEPTRAFVVVSENDERHYTSVQAVLNDAGLLDQVLARALKELEAFERKYQAYQELAGVFAAARKVRRRIDAKSSS